LKAGTSGGDWYLLDTMRGIGPDNNQNEVVTRYIEGNENANENYTNIMKIDNSNGFKFKLTDGDGEYNANTMIYIAIAAETGRTSKEIKAGSASSVFAIDNSPTSTEPNFTSGFPVDIGLVKDTNGGGNWVLTGRKLQSTYLTPNSNGVRGTAATNYTFDVMTGMWKASLSGTTYQAWMWKRHAGFDVAEYKGSGSADYVYHSLGRLPEMIWVKRKNGTTDWRVYHKGLGTSNDPQDYGLKLNQNTAQNDNATLWNDAAPELTRFTVGSNGDVNANGEDYMAISFASVDGISKVGSYTGNGGVQTITFGFQPRFLIIRAFTSNANWHEVDTVRGWSASGDSYLMLNATNPGAGEDFGTPTSTGWTINPTQPFLNNNGVGYIYYAHA